MNYRLRRVVSALLSLYVMFSHQLDLGIFLVSKKQNHKTEYPSMPSDLRPDPHGEGLPIPTSPFRP